MDLLRAYLLAGTEGNLLSWRLQQQAAHRFGVSLGQVEVAALEAGILPARYQRNRQTISLANQLRLARSRVTVIGCGGLGGYIIEQLARLGVGQITAIDPDVFEEHNLNRQILSTVTNIGQPKVVVAQARVAEVNPAVTLTPVYASFAEADGSELLRNSQLVIDALDSIPIRLELAKVCRQMDIPLVHGAIAGWYGTVTSQFPSDRSIETLYRAGTEGKGIEKKLGNPAFTPAVVASLEVAEVCKILLAEGKPLRGRKLALDLFAMEFHEIEVSLPLETQ